MIHPDTEVRYISETIGYGVVATRLIPRGTVTWCLDPLDQVITPGQLESFAPNFRELLEKYAFRDRQGNHVLCWDNGRFVNHSFRPNCLPAPYDIELAVRDIQPGEELTDHYGALNLLEPFRALPEPGTRRRTVYPHDIVRHHRAWDQLLKRAFRELTEVRQPLLPYLPEDTRATVLNIASRRAPMGSCIETWCPPQLETAV